MTKLYLDIETLPTESNEQIDHVVSKIKAPGNYKKPEAIEKYIAGVRDETVKKTALSGLFGRVYMIGYAFDNNEAGVIYDESEASVLAQLDGILIQRGLRSEFGDKDFVIVGHNAKDFDVPFLSQRMMINGFAPLFRHGHKSVQASVHDTMQMFACGRYKQYYSLESLCLAFGLPCSKGEMDGSQVYDYYKAGRHAEVIEYCKGDIDDTRRVYRAMTEQLRSAA